MAVLVGVEAVQDRVPQLAVEVPDGLESLVEETKVPDDAKPVCRKTLKLKSRVESADHVVPLSAESTRWPLAYVLGEERIQKYPPADGAVLGRKISAYCVPDVRVADEPNVAV